MGKFPAIVITLGICSLWDIIKVVETRGLTGPTAKWVFLEACKAVEECHKQKLAHLDIKCENFVLMKDYSVNLIDFGHCEATAPGLKHRYTSKGTAGYLAPEQLKQRKYNAMQADIYQLGVLFFHLYLGYSPFNQEIYHEHYYYSNDTRRGFFGMFKTSIRPKISKNFMRFV